MSALSSVQSAGLALKLADLYATNTSKQFQFTVRHGVVPLTRFQQGQSPQR